MILWGKTLRELFDLGGYLMWPLLVFSILAAALVLDRTWTHYRLRLDFRRFVDHLQKLVSAGKTAQAVEFCARHRSPVARTAEAYLRHLDRADEIRSGAVELEGAQALELLEQRQRGLSALAHIATLTGLLGTVAGLVRAFQQIEAAGGQVQPSDLAGGIWAALLTTVFGLTIAIPSFIAFHWFESRSDRKARRMEYIVSYLDQWLGRHTTGRPRSADAPTPPAGIREE